MKERHVDTLTLAASLEAGDLLVVEENSELKQANVALLTRLASYNEEFSALPQVYTGFNIKGGVSTYTRRGVFKAISSMISAAYGGVTLGNKLRLFIFESAGPLFKAADWSVSGSVVTAEYVDSTSATFGEDDWGEYQAFIMSPWGLVPGTDSFVDAAALGSVSPEFAATHSNTYALTTPSVSGTVEVGTLDPTIEYPFAVLYKDATNFVRLYILNGLVWIELFAGGVVRSKPIAVPTSPFTFSASVDILTGECSAVFDGTTLVVVTAEGEAFGYESGADTYVFGTTVGADVLTFGIVPIISGNPETIYIGKDFTETFFYNAIYDITFA